MQVDLLPARWRTWFYNFAIIRFYNKVKAECNRHNKKIYHDLRLRLRHDLNTNPAPETEALYRSLLARETRPVSLPSASQTPDDLAKARLYLEEACAIDLEFGQRAGHAAWRLGDVLCMLGDYAGSRTLLIESLKTARELDDKVVVFSSLEFLAWLAHSQGASEQAAWLYRAADVLRTTFGYTLSPSDQKKHVARTTAVRATLGDVSYSVGWEQGRAMSLEQTVEYALA
jgi:hypothetical protein